MNGPPKPRKYSFGTHSNSEIIVWITYHIPVESRILFPIAYKFKANQFVTNDERLIWCAWYLIQHTHNGPFQYVIELVHHCKDSYNKRVFLVNNI